MSANLSPATPVTLKAWLAQATQRLEAAGITSARLDSLIMLSDALKRDTSWILAHLDDAELHDDTLLRINTWLVQREQRIPLAYIRGWIEFYGRRFIVTPSVLIPRPETEAMIDIIKNLSGLPGNKSGRPLLIDVGAGSGCIGITAKLERPELELVLTDVDKAALAVARQNCSRLFGEQYAATAHAPVACRQQDLLTQWPASRAASIIAANLPYVGAGYSVTPDARHEPSVALFADDDGYALIERLLPQAANALHVGGYLVLESDPWQQQRIIRSAAAHGFELYERQRFHLALKAASVSSAASL